MKLKIILEFDSTVNILSCGLRQNWIDGERGKEKVNLSCGAGTGSPWLIFSKTSNGKTKYLAADIRTVITQLDKLL